MRSDANSTTSTDDTEPVSTPDAAQRMLLAALLELRPRSVLRVGADADLALAQYRERHPACRISSEGLPRSLDELAVEGRFQLGVLSGLVETLAARRAAELITALRDRYCESLLLLASKGHWRLTDFLALGFEIRSSSGERAGGYDLYWYHPDRYNPEREWNNPDSWANPENFKRYRW
jgi:hypothetical protein